MFGRKHDKTTETDDDLIQGMDLLAAMAWDARQRGDKKREAAAHESLNGSLDEGERRGLFGKKRR